MRLLCMHQSLQNRTWGTGKAVSPCTLLDKEATSTCQRMTSVLAPAVQIDAAINPGNSGGPAFSSLQKGLVAGVAFSKLAMADNVG